MLLDEREAIPGELTVHAADGLASVAPQEWDGLVGPGQGALRHGYMTAWERVQLAGLRSRPLLAREGTDGRLVAAAPGYFYELDVSCMKQGHPPAWLSRLRRVNDRLLKFRVFEVGCPVALCPPLLHAPDLSIAEAAQVLLPEAAAEADRGEAHVLVVQDFPHPGGACAEILEASGLAPVPVMPTVTMDLGFGSFEHYLDSMRASYRRRARRALEQSSGLTVELRHDFAELAGELAGLARMVFDRAGEIRREILTEEYFAAASAQEALSVLLLRRADGSLACFGLLMDDRPWLHFLNCGFGEAAGREEGAYFRLLYEIVRAGIERGYAQINFGLTTVAPKLDVGGSSVPLLAFIRYHRPMIQGLCAVGGRRLMAGKSSEARHVFKDGAPPGESVSPAEALVQASIRP
ncbi:MAG TPA: GNAT family N-acetyltransferase [Solirubrobacteraceae bacterium]|nr:GNAT family N-acetyltransferase [Solirubrobacteraceae bacterium]